MDTDAIERVTAVVEQMERAIDNTERAYPTAAMLDRGTIIENMRRWAKKLRCVLIDLHAVPVAVVVPDGLEDRIEAALNRINNNQALQRIPADPTDVDLVLAEVLALIRGNWPPCWIHATKQPAAQTQAEQKGAEVAADETDYTPGELDRTAPARIWLQINTTGNNFDRDEPWPGADGITWQGESIGGLEIKYVRADIAVQARED
uniref:hypothetical protein n=1 Tax=Xanthomonas albilineans TaxID=29447 RepID=UPI0027DD1C11|nr:hypothetical protein [Xanthomonas albilineans]